MSANAKGRDMQELQQRVKELDLKGIMARVEKEHGLDETTKNRAEELYRQYLVLRGLYPELEMAPPKLADEVWHHHVLDTRKYQDDCKAVFGDFMHHTPHEGVPEKAWANTKNLFARVFNIDLETANLPKTAMQSGGCS